MLGRSCIEDIEPPGVLGHVEQAGSAVKATMARASRLRSKVMVSLCGWIESFTERPREGLHVAHVRHPAPIGRVSARGARDRQRGRRPQESLLRAAVPRPGSPLT